MSQLSLSRFFNVFLFWAAVQVAVGEKERKFFDNIRGDLCLVSVSNQKVLIIRNVRLCTESSVLKHSWLHCGVVNIQCLSIRSSLF